MVGHTSPPPCRQQIARAPLRLGLQRPFPRYCKYIPSDYCTHTDLIVESTFVLEPSYKTYLE